MTTPSAAPCRVHGIHILVALSVVVALLAGSAAANPDAVLDEATAEEFRTAYATYQSLVAENRYEEALPHARRALELGRTLYGADDRSTAALTLNLGSCLRKANQAGEAVAVLRDALDRYERIHGDDAAELVDPLVELGNAAIQNRGTPPYLQFYTRALRIVARNHGRESAMYADIAMEAGQQLAFRAQDPQGRRYLADAHEILRGLPGNEIQAGLAALHLGKYELAAGNLSRAEPLLQEALREFEQSGPENRHLELTAHAFLVEAFDRRGDIDAAQEHIVAIGRLSPTVAVEDYVPLVRHEPEYPASALRSGAEGFTEVEFSVDESGAVRDARVVESDGHRDFPTAALAAIAKFRYAPRFVEGQPVVTTGLRHRFTFSPMRQTQRKRCELAMRLYRATRFPSVRTDLGTYPMDLPIIPPECQ